MKVYIDDRNGHELRETRHDLLLIFDYFLRHPLGLDATGAFTLGHVKSYVRWLHYMHGINGKHACRVSVSPQVLYSLVGILTYGVDSYCYDHNVGKATYDKMFGKASPDIDHRIAQIEHRLQIKHARQEVGK